MLNYTKSYDRQLRSINIFGRYPILMPFVGDVYPISKLKILFVGESHFLPPSYNNTIFKEWYIKNLDEHKFSEESKRWLDTRTIIDSDVIEGVKQNNSHSIYRNAANIYGEVLEIGDYRKSLSHLSFYNYFLRPAEVTGKSLRIIDWEEELVSFDTLVKVYEILQPSQIIFLTSLARQSFHRVRWSDERKETGDKIEKFVSNVPHPGSAWWNRVAKKYGDKSGKEWLREILIRLDK